MKTTLIDDLVGDTFALLYETVVPDLIAKSNDEENRDRMRVDHLLMNPEASPAAANANSPAPPLPLPGQAFADQPATTRPRPKGVGRRDIQKKAESLVSRSAIPTPATFSSSSKPSKPPTSVPTALQPLDTVIPPTDAAPDGGGAAREKDISSVPGSVHDSADDESELSDIEEEAETGVMTKDETPMFPGLLGRVDAEVGVGEEEEGEGEEGDPEGDGAEDDGGGGKDCGLGNEDADEDGEGMRDEGG